MRRFLSNYFDLLFTFTYVILCYIIVVHMVVACPCWPQAVVQTQSISWQDVVKGDLNHALISLGLVLHMLVVFINCCLGFCVVTQ